MAFITSNGLTESETSRTVQAGGMTVHYHDIGTGEPVLFLHSYGPGTTAWITFQRPWGRSRSTSGASSWTCPISARPGRSSTARASTPCRRGPPSPSWTRWASREALATPTRENIRRYLRVHIDDEALVTDELVDYIHRAHTWSPEFDEARRQSVSVPHDYTPELAGIQAPVLLIHGRYDRMVAFEVSLAILNHVTDSRVVLLNSCGHWAPFEKPEEYTAHVLAFLKGYWGVRQPE